MTEVMRSADGEMGVVERELMGVGAGAAATHLRSRRVVLSIHLLMQRSIVKDDPHQELSLGSDATAVGMEDLADLGQRVTSTVDISNA